MTKPQRSHRTSTGRADKITRSQWMAELFAGRDWTGIFIELGIVTLGVFLAFQIDQWGQNKRQAREERQFLERMWVETATIARESGLSAKQHIDVAAVLLNAYRSRNDDQQLQQLETQTGGLACRVITLPSQGLSDTTAQELLNSGRLNIISDANIRQQLREMAASQAEAAEQLAYARQFAPLLTESLDPHIANAIDDAGQHTCTVRWPALLADPQAVKALIRGRRIHIVMGEARSDVRDRAARAHQSISCKIGKKDCS